MRAMTRIKALIKKEFLAIFKDPQNRAIILIPPILQLVVFAHAITLEVLNIDISILDYSKSYYSRELISKFQASKWFRKIHFANNLEDIKNSINLKSSQMALVIQNDFHKNINSQKTNDILVILDGRQTNSAGIISNYANQIIANYNFELEKKFNIKKPNINIIIRNWYNPNIDYKWFLTVSLIVLLSLSLGIILSALSIARERELGTFNQLLVSPLNRDEILISKTIPPLLVAFFSTMIITFIVSEFFKIPFSGSIFLYALSTFISMFSIIGVGLFISSLSYTQQQAILGVFVFQTPAVLLSGFVSPIEDMPLFFQYLSMLNPLRYYMLINKGIYFKNMDFNTVFLNLIPLILIAFLTLGVARWSFKRQADWLFWAWR